LCATTNSGGAKNWRADHAELLRGRDVVVLVDNDEPGRDRGKAIAASLHGIAKRVRVLDFSHRDIWPAAPKGADISDWVKAREGTAEDLAAIIETLSDAKPAAAVHDDEPPPASPQDYGSEPIAPVQRSGNRQDGETQARDLPRAWWRDPATIPPRSSLYEGHYTRRAIGATIGAGGRAKTNPRHL